jgi:hypothetical protein
LEEKLLRHEGIIHTQGLNEDAADQAFFTRSQPYSNKPLNKKEQHQKDIAYLKDLKARAKCYNYREYNHWATDCPKPKKKRPPNKKNHKIDQGFSAANLAKSLRITSSASSSSDSDAIEDDSTGDFVLVATSVISSHAYVATTVSDIWYADSSASEHMTDK